MSNAKPHIKPAEKHVIESGTRCNPPTSEITPKTTANTLAQRLTILNAISKLTYRRIVSAIEVVIARAGVIWEIGRIASADSSVRPYDLVVSYSVPSA